MDARTEAATRAIQAAWITAAHPMMRDGLNTQEYAEQAHRLANVALTAADALSAPLAEQLATALRAIVGESWHRGGCRTHAQGRVDEARAVLAVFDAARADPRGTAREDERDGS